MSEPTLEDKLQSAFGATMSGTGEEELLRVASKYSLQYTGKQIAILLYLSDLAVRFDCVDKVMSRRLFSFVESYRAMKENHNSDGFVMAALESIALKKFMGANALKVNVEK